MLSTVIAGVLVFLVGQLVLKCVIEPVQVLTATIARVSNLLLLYQAKLTNASCDDAIAEDMKRLSAEIISHSYHILCFPVSRLAFGLPSRMSLVNAAKELNMLYYGMLHAARKDGIGGGYGSGSDRVMRNINAMKRIGELLGIMTDYSATPRPVLIVRLFIAAKKWMGRRLLSQRIATPPDNPAPDHTSPTAPRR
jgi:hypothetical protein